MKKLVALVVAVFAVLTMSLSVFAAGSINADEQRVLDILATKIDVKGVKVGLVAENITKAENYFKTIDLSKTQADTAIAAIQKGIDLLKEAQVKDVFDLPFEKKEELLGYGNEAIGVVNMTITYDITEHNFKIYDDATQNIVYLQDEVIKTMGGTYWGYVFAGAALLLAAGFVFISSKKKVEA